MPIFKDEMDVRDLNIKKGDLYLPLKGATFDGEDFCDKAIENGAVGCFYTKEETPNFKFFRLFSLNVV